MGVVHRVIAFMGGSRDALAAVSRTLPTCVKALAASGVVVPRAGRTGNRASGVTHQPLAAPNSPGWVALQAELESADANADTVLLVIPGMLRMTRAANRRAQLLKRLSGVADEVVVTSVVGDQLTLINEAYLAQVSTWRNSKRLDSLLTRFFDNDVFMHETVLRPWYDDESPARYCAVPLPDIQAGHPVAALLSGCGVDLQRVPSQDKVELTPRLGPVGVEAARLLVTYVRARVRGFDPSAPAVAAGSRSALARAAKLGWCTEPFWGWNRRAAEKALARFEASNHRFAQAVWGTGWTVPYPLERLSTRVDFLDLDPVVVDQVQRYVTSTANRLKREQAAAR